MKKVLLSHDGKMKMYLVPDEVADNLKEYCMHFGFDWLMNDPNAQKLRVITPSGIIGYIFGAQDFIDYLNDFIFPNQKSTLVGEMDFYDYEIPEEYKDIRRSQVNFGSYQIGSFLFCCFWRCFYGKDQR